MSIFPPLPVTLNCRGQLLDLVEPRVMGILNVTPDSFSDGGRFNSLDAALKHAEAMIGEGADMIDIGGYSTRPGADDIPVEEELRRVVPVVEALRQHFPAAILSIDTFRAPVARAVLDRGAHIINDISGGLFDPEMLATVAEYDAPYVLMHIQGTPQTMQKNPTYVNVVEDILDHLTERVKAARAAGITDIIVDPGFGFGKTLAHNYELFRNLDKFLALGLPLLVGISRKSMLYRPFKTSPDDVTELSAAMHLQALRAGARILRVHDVKPAHRIAQLHQYLEHGTV